MRRFFILSLLGLALASPLAWADAPMPNERAQPLVQHENAATPAAVQQDTKAEESAGGLPQLDVAKFPGQLFWLAITFSITYLLMRFLALPAVGVTLAAREKRIAADLAAAKALNAEAKLLAHEYEKGLQTARYRAQDVLERAHSQATRQISEAVAAQGTKLDLLVKDAETRLQAAQHTAQASLRQDAVAVVAELLKSVAGAEASPAAITTALDEARQHGGRA